MGRRNAALAFRKLRRRSCAMPDFTRLFSALDAGDPRAVAELLPLVYEELRKLAAQKMSQEAAGHMLHLTANQQTSKLGA